MQGIRRTTRPKHPTVHLAVLALGAASAFFSFQGTAAAGEIESRALFDQARQLRQDGKCDEAVKLFRRAFETYPEGLGSLRNIAECEEEMGRFASARRDYSDLRLAVLQSKEARYEGWDKDAEAAHKRLESRVARVIIKMKGPATAQIYVNGRPLDPRLAGTELEMDLGPTDFTLRDGTASPPTKSIKIEEGQKYTVELESHAPDAGTTTPGPGGTGGGTGANPGGKPGGQTPGGSAGSEGSGDDGTGLMVGGVVALSLAGLAAVGFGVSLGVRQGALSDLEGFCPNVDAQSCSVGNATDRADAASAKSTGQTASTLVNVFAIGGGVAAAAGIGLLVASAMQGGEADSGKDAAKSAVRLQAVPDFGGGGHLLLQGSF